MSKLSVHWQLWRLMSKYMIFVKRRKKSNIDRMKTTASSERWNTHTPYHSVKGKLPKINNI